MEFYSKAIFNGNSEERKILQETFQETVAELNTKASNANQKELEWAAGYVSAEVLITLALSKGITKVVDSVADAGKVGSVVLNNADDLSKASLQAASKSMIGSADDVGKVASKMDDLHFAAEAAKHMDETGRFVPMQSLKEAIMTGVTAPDPQGSRAVMYYTTMTRNGKLYNLEVLYDEMTNTIYHFKYTDTALGPLKATK